MQPLLFFFLIHFVSPAAAEIAGETSALISFRNSVGRKVLPWNTLLSPCKWKGVTCTNNSVTSLRLPGRGLSGQIPTGTLSNLSNLRTLSLHHNQLSGQLPSDLSRCTKLVSLYLNKNLFVGEFPSFIPSITSLIRVNLAGNDFSGEIPSSLNSLKQINLLCLENNHFSGELPNLNLPKLKFFNVSFNPLTGSVPENLRGEKASSFMNTSLCGMPLQSCFPPPADSSSLSGCAIAGITVGAIAVFLLIIFALFLLFRFKGKDKDESFTETVITGKKKTAAVEEPSPGLKKELVFVGDLRPVFELEDLLRASAEVLGKGGCGIAYKAAVKEDLVVAVKRLKNVKMGEEEFAEKVKEISGLKHPNVVPLLAYYYSRAEKLLVYDYMPLGSLHFLLHG